MSDHKGARLMPDALPSAKMKIGDRGSVSNWLRAALTEKGIAPCMPCSKSRKVKIPHDKTLYRQRHKIETMFDRLKNWQRIATRLTIDAPRPSSQPSALQPSAPSISIHEAGA